MLFSKLTLEFQEGKLRIWHPWWQRLMDPKQFLWVESFLTSHDLLLIGHYQIIPQSAGWRGRGSSWMWSLGESTEIAFTNSSEYDVCVKRSSQKITSTCLRSSHFSWSDCLLLHLLQCYLSISTVYVSLLVIRDASLKLRGQAVRIHTTML